MNKHHRNLKNLIKWITLYRELYFYWSYGGIKWKKFGLRGSKGRILLNNSAYPKVEEKSKIPMTNVWLKNTSNTWSVIQIMIVNIPIRFEKQTPRKPSQVNLIHTLNYKTGKVTEQQLSVTYHTKEKYS